MSPFPKSNNWGIIGACLDQLVPSVGHGQELTSLVQGDWLKCGERKRSLPWPVEPDRSADICKWFSQLFPQWLSSESLGIEKTWLHKDMSHVDFLHVTGQCVLSNEQYWKGLLCCMTRKFFFIHYFLPLCLIQHLPLYCFNPFTCSHSPFFLLLSLFLECLT